MILHWSYSLLLLCVEINECCSGNYDTIIKQLCARGDLEWFPFYFVLVQAVVNYL
jgi:hypothetical protein